MLCDDCRPDYKIGDDGRKRPVLKGQIVTKGAVPKCDECASIIV